MLVQENNHFQSNPKKIIKNKKTGACDFDV